MARRPRISNNKAIDDYLINKPVKRIGDFVNSKVKILWNCLNLECNYLWKAKIRYVLYGKSICPKCSGRAKLSNDIVDERLNNSSIIRIGNVIGLSTEKIDFKCKICNYIWKTSPSSLCSASSIKKRKKSNKDGCPNCSGNARLTNEIIDNRLHNKDIKRIGECINSLTKIEWKCTKNNCNHIWRAIPKCILSGTSKCFKCYEKSNRLTNEIVDKRLKDNNIVNVIRVSDIVNASSKLKWQDKRCFHTWNAYINNITASLDRCPKCAISSKKLTNEIIDNRLSSRPIKRIGDYVDIYAKIKWKCLKLNCGFEWLFTPNNVVNRKSNCPACSETKYITNEIIDWRIRFKEIKRLSKYTNAKSNIKWKCLKCNYIWRVSAGGIFGLKNTGCPKCAGTLSLNNNIIDERIIGRNLKRIEDYKSSHTKIKWICLENNCNNIWLATPNNIISGKGCPICAIPTEKLIFSFLKNNSVNFEYQKRIDSICPLETLKYRMDFYFPDKRIAMEYNGRQHYVPVKFGTKMTEEDAEKNLIKQKKRDEYIRSFCDKEKITLIEIDGQKYPFKKLIKFLKNSLLNIIGDIK